MDSHVDNAVFILLTSLHVAIDNTVVYTMVFVDEQVGDTIHLLTKFEVNMCFVGPEGPHNTC